MDPVNASSMLLHPGTASMRALDRSEVVGRRFEALFVETLLKPVRLTESTSVTAGMWVDLLKTHLAEALASQQSLGVSKLIGQERGMGKEGTW